MQKNKQRGSAIAMVIGPITKTKDKGPCKCYHEVSFRSISIDDPYNVGSIRFRNYYCSEIVDDLPKSNIIELQSVVKRLHKVLMTPFSSG